MLSDQIKEAMSLHNEDLVTFIEEYEDEPCLQTKAVRVGERIKRILFDMTTSVVVTSATLSSNGRFDYVASEFGLDRPATVIAETPFDFSSQTLLVVPEGLPNPNDDDYRLAVAECLHEIIELAGGRTLALFTSYRNLDAAHERLSATCGYRVLRQGDMPRTALIEEFRKDVSSVLLGTDAFWAGVDVPGEALSCVVIDRLPFPSPEDPVVDAISSTDKRWFHRYALPRAIIAFRQGFGRLIRRRTDRGVVVVLDQRIVTKGYGRAFLGSLPGGGGLRTRHLPNIAKFLGTKSGE